MVILITGSNRGLGIELVKEGLNRGHKIIATYRTSCEEFFKLKDIFADRLDIEVMDVSDLTSIVVAYKRISKKYDAMDGIINNAAVLFESKAFRGDPIVDINIKKFYETFEINTFGPVRVLKQFMPLIYKGVDRCIVNITTEGAKLKSEGSHYIAYSSSKAALNMYTQKIRNYLSAQENTSDIRVYMIHPGRMFTMDKTRMGVENAQVQPSESSFGIWDIIEKKKEINLDIPFINYKGEQIPL